MRFINKSIFQTEIAERDIEDTVFYYMERLQG